MLLKLSYSQVFFDLEMTETKSELKYECLNMIEKDDQLGLHCRARKPIVNYAIDRNSAA